MNRIKSVTVLLVVSALTILMAMGCAKRTSETPPESAQRPAAAPAAEQASDEASPSGAPQPQDTGKELSYAEAIKLGKASIGRRACFDAEGWMSGGALDDLDYDGMVWGGNDSNGETLGFIGLDVDFFTFLLSTGEDSERKKAIKQATIRGTIARFEGECDLGDNGQTAFSKRRGPLVILKDAEVEPLD